MSTHTYTSEQYWGFVVKYKATIDHEDDELIQLSASIHNCMRQITVYKNGDKLCSKIDLVNPGLYYLVVDKEYEKMHARDAADDLDEYEDY